MYCIIKERREIKKKSCVKDIKYGVVRNLLVLIIVCIIVNLDKLEKIIYLSEYE